MKNTVKLAMVGVLVAAGTANLAAQSNVVQNINIALSANVQSGDNTMTITRVGTKDVITAISADQQGVPAKAKLLLLTPIEGGNFSVILRAAGVEDTDVTSFFGQSTIGTPVVKTTGTTGTQASVQEFTFHSSTINFDVQGYTTGKTVNLKGGGTATTQNAAVAGTGDVNGKAAVYKGSINTSGSKGE